MEAISTSLSTIRHISINDSQPSSPKSTALPSPPDSPSDDSVSSFPSLSSSFFFSSSAHSPHPHSQSTSDKEFTHDSTQCLIIPSLSLPPTLRRPTFYGQTLGNLRLLLLGPSSGAGRSFISGILLEDNDDILEVGAWEESPSGCSVLQASTSWIEERDAHGLERYELAKNLEIYDLPPCESGDDPQALLQTITSIIQAPFHAVSNIIASDHHPSTVLINLLASPTTPLVTALVILLSDPQLPSYQQIISTLSPLVPTILLPLPTTSPSVTHPHSASTTASSTHTRLSALQPKSPLALRAAFFRRPETLSMLRKEAAERFCVWREIDAVAKEIRESCSATKAPLPWDKAKWDSEWEANLSKDVALHLHATSPSPPSSSPSFGACNPSFDPLHLPSLLIFSLSLLGPLRSRLAEFIRNGGWYLGMGFCIGFGVGVFLR